MFTRNLKLESLETRQLLACATGADAPECDDTESAEYGTTQSELRTTWWPANVSGGSLVWNGGW